jgi:predicted hydrolase (HD superfamily)
MVAIRRAVARDDDLMPSAAVLHDIGYSPGLVDSGFHAIDGARYLRDYVGADDLIVRLVAHHSCAAIEAEERDLVFEMGEFEPAAPLLTDALIYCDMTTTPDGEVTTVDARIAEIKQRYGNEGPVGRFIVRAESELTAATRRIEELLQAAELGQSTTG